MFFFVLISNKITSLLQHFPGNVKNVKVAGENLRVTDLHRLRAPKFNSTCRNILGSTTYYYLLLLTTTYYYLLLLTRAWGGGQWDCPNILGMGPLLTVRVARIDLKMPREWQCPTFDSTHHKIERIFERMFYNVSKNTKNSTEQQTMTFNMTTMSKNKHKQTITLSQQQYE